ncbi:MAG: NADH-quinone oxidoreductase subunit J [Bdellovibrionota bacterium]
MQAGRIFFWIVASAGLLSAFLAVTTRNVVRAAIWLATTLFTIAICYVMLSADFLAAAQVLIYIGGIIVMILFTVMFTRRSGEESYVNPTKGPLTIAGAAVFSAGLFYLMFQGFQKLYFKVLETPTVQTTLEPVGDALLTRFVLPFEIVSVLLLMSLVGAVILIKKEIKEAPPSGK